MRKLRIILPILIAFAGVILFSQCKKDHSCKMKLTCYYSPNGMDVGPVVSNAIITFDTTKYVSGLAISPNISCVHLDSLNLFTKERLYEICEGPGYPYKTDKSGVFTYTLEYPALIIVNATKVDKDSLGNYTKYTGTVQVQLNEGETTEKSILMVQTN
jgi:hypothetical protein